MSWVPHHGLSRPKELPMQQEFSPDEARRWEVWQHANAVDARRSDRIARFFGVTMLVATLTAVAVAMWR
jgi:hypothetical protein